MKLVYIANTIDSAFNSQVVELLNFLVPKVASVTLILSYKKKVHLNIPGVKIYYYKHIHEYPGTQFIHGYYLKKIFKKIKLDSNTIIHTRGPLAAYYAVIALGNNTKCKILADVRGATIEEITDYLNVSTFQKYLKVKLIKRAFKHFNKISAISVVSNKLKSHLLNSYGLTNKIFVNTCIAGQNFTFNSSKRKEYRDKLGLSEKNLLLIFATGGNSPWQKTDHILNSLKKLGVTILLLGDKGKSEGNIVRMRVPFDEMPNYLSAGDVAVIYRDKDVVNQVAAPIKFSEYLGCGLPVIANDGVCQIVEIIEQENCGIIVNDFSLISESQLFDLSQKNKKELSSIAEKYFNINTIGQQYLSSYLKLT